MYQEDSGFKQHVHLLGVSYLINFLKRCGYNVLEVNTDPNHHYQLLVDFTGETLLIAARTGLHPKLGMLDTNTREQLIRESEVLDAIPHFASLSVVSGHENYSGLDDPTEGHQFRVIIYGITAIHKSETLSTNK